MIRDKLKSIHASLKRIPKRKFYVGFLFSVLLASLIGVTYAKYIDYVEINETANVAKIGVKTFELKEHKATINDYDSIMKDGVLYKLDKTADGEVTGNSYERVLPGVNIPKDPFIRLELKSEVSYELYLKVKGSYIDEGTGQQMIGSSVKYNIITQETEGTKGFWELADETQNLYKFVISSDSNGNKNYIFKAGTSYEYNDTNGLIKIIKNDMIYISQHYAGNEGFKIEFETYLKQVLI